MNASTPIYIIHHLPKTGGVSLRNWLTRHLGFHRGMVHYGVAGEIFCMQHQLPFLEQLTTEHLNNVRVVMGHYVTEATADFFPSRTIRRLIILREPTKRIISQYNHAMHYWCREMGRQQISFHEWFERYAVARYDYKNAIRTQGLKPELAFQSQASLGPNYMARFIAQNFGKTNWPELTATEFADQVNALLETFWHIGLTEHLSDFVAHLGNTLGTPADIAHDNRGDQRGIFLEPDANLIEFIRAHNQADYLIYDYWKNRSMQQNH